MNFETVLLSPADLCTPKHCTACQKEAGASGSAPVQMTYRFDQIWVLPGRIRLYPTNAGPWSVSRSDGRSSKGRSSKASTRCILVYGPVSDRDPHMIEPVRFHRLEAVLSDPGVPVVPQTRGSGRRAILLAIGEIINDIHVASSVEETRGDERLDCGEAASSVGLTEAVPAGTTYGRASLQH